MSKKILILGGSNIFSEQIADHLSHYIDCQVDTLFVTKIFDDNSKKIRKRYQKDDFLFDFIPNNNNIDIYDKITNSYIINNIEYDKINNYSMYCMFSSLMNQNEYDAVFANYITGDFSFLSGLKRNVFLACCFYGSDLLNNTQNYQNYHKIYDLLERANLITCMSRYMREIIKIKYTHALENKIKIVNFGLNSDLLENIRILREQKEDCKKIVKNYLNIHSSKKIIFIGNSAAGTNKQLQIIYSIIRYELTNYFVLILPFHYSNNKYLDEIERMCNLYAIEYVLLKEKLDVQLLAVLRCGVDAYIHTPISDSFGGTLHEFIYANVPVVLGSWLFFEHLYDLNLNVITVDHVDYVGNALKYLIQPSFQITPLNEDHEKLLNYIDHDKVKVKWFQCIPVEWIKNV